MPSTFIPVPPFPNVPQLPGVPQLTRSPIGALAATVPTIIRSLLAPAMPGVLFHAVKAAPVWGIFDETGSQVISPDSILDFGYRAEYRVSDYPVQAGQFANYNKVTVPYEASVKMVKGSDLDARIRFTDACETVAASLALYSIITPEKTYVNVNPIRLEILRRETAGAFFIEAEMYFRQIQQVTPQYSSTTAAAANTANAQNPAATPQQNLGIVQPQAVPSAVSLIVSDILSGQLPPIPQSPFFPNPLGP
jgi:hypothetical protein